MQALAIGKPLDKMQSVPEAAGEGEALPSAHQLLDWGYGAGQTHAQPDQGDKVRIVGWTVHCSAYGFCAAGRRYERCMLCLVPAVRFCLHSACMHSGKLEACRKACTLCSGCCCFGTCCMADSLNRAEWYVVLCVPVSTAHSASNIA